MKLPTGWINAGGLKLFRRDLGQEGNNVAALMRLTVHHAENKTGSASGTYDFIECAPSTSFAEILGGVGALERHGLHAA